MKFENYCPSWRNVIFHEVRPEKTSNGLYIPKADFKLSTFDSQFNNEKEHKADQKIGEFVVLKVGNDCTQIKPGDKIMLEPGYMPQSMKFDDVIVFQIKEMQIAGYSRD